MKKTRKNKAKWRAFRALTPYIVIVSLGIAMLFAAWLIPTVNEVLALARPDREVIIEIPEESSRADVAKILKKNDVIEHTAVFKTFALLTKREAEFPAGRYKVNSNMDYRAMLRRLTSKKAALNTVMVTIPEGYEVSQIVKLLEDKGVCEEKSLLEAIANSDFDYAFLDGVPLGKTNRLEGYLFPDTYEFYKDRNIQSGLIHRVQNSHIGSPYHTEADKSILNLQGDSFDILYGVFWHDPLNPFTSRIG